MKQLRDIINEIRDYQYAMGNDFDEMSNETRMQNLRNFTVALSCEQTELLDEVSWKPWRTYDSQKPNPNKRKLALEWVDCLFFLVDQSFCLELSSGEILEAFEKKLKANYQRIHSGYSEVKTDKTVIPLKEPL